MKKLLYLLGIGLSLIIGTPKIVHAQKSAYPQIDFIKNIVNESNPTTKKEETKPAEKLEDYLLKDGEIKNLEIGIKEITHYSLNEEELTKEGIIKRIEQKNYLYNPSKRAEEERALLFQGAMQFNTKKDLENRIVKNQEETYCAPCMHCFIINEKNIVGFLMNKEDYEKLTPLSYIPYLEFLLNYQKRHNAKLISNPLQKFNQEQYFEVLKQTVEKYKKEGVWEAPEKKLEGYSLDQIKELYKIQNSFAK